MTIDTVTLLQDVRGRPLTKSFRRVGSRIVKGSYPNASEFRAFEVEVDGIGPFAATLDEVAADGHAALIRGAPGRFHPRNGSPAFRLLQPQEGLASARTGARISQQQIRLGNLQPDDEHRWAVTWLPTFEDRPRRWVIFDVDRVRAPDHLAEDWIDEPETAVEHVLALLPELFRTATCWWSVSSSAAIPGPHGREVSQDIRLKLGFWLDRPLLGTELKRWMAAGQAPVDPAVFGAVQLIYIARPGFGDGLHDPVPRRSGVWQGETDTVEVPAFLPEPEPAIHQSDAAAFGPVEGLEELRDALRLRLVGEPHVRQHLLQAAAAYARQHGPNIDQAALVAVLESVALEYRTQTEVAAYGVDSLVAYVVQQERAANWMPLGRPPRLARLKPYFGPEGANRFALLNDQRRFIRSWISRQHVYALARQEISERRAAAFAAEGLA
jgi:hypothetical protein